jgi:hypothetical protein
MSGAGEEQPPPRDAARAACGAVDGWTSEGWTLWRSDTGSELFVQNGAV